jgi:hypothetical protein
MEVMVCLPARNGGGVKAGIFGVWLCPTEGVANGLRILRGEQHPHDLAAMSDDVNGARMSRVEGERAACQLFRATVGNAQKLGLHNLTSG